MAKNAQHSKTVKVLFRLRQWVIRRFDQGPIPEVRVVITRRKRIDVDLRFSLLEIKRADQVDVLPRIGRNIFDDVGVGEQRNHYGTRSIMQSIFSAASRREAAWRAFEG
jgi:hypothetical protein